jgi:hypothetical protein
MADYYATARTNYFKLADVAAVAAAVALCEKVGLSVSEGEGGAYAFISENDRGWPEDYYDEEKEETIDVDLEGEFGKLAAADEVVIMVESGSEGARYCVGYAIAIRNGEILRITINDIYDLVEKTWGVKPSMAIY